jgi:hypothetical protein
MSRFSTPPLIYAVTNKFYQKWVLKVLEILTEAGANWSVVDNYYGSVLHAALRQRNRKEWDREVHVDIIK